MIEFVAFLFILLPLIVFPLMWEAFSYFSRPKAAVTRAPREVYSEKYWHDDWNRQFVALGGKRVLTQAEQAEWEELPSWRPMKCNLCGLPHREKDCDEYDLWVEGWDEDED